MDEQLEEIIEGIIRPQKGQPNRKFHIIPERKPSTKYETRDIELAHLCADASALTAQEIETIGKDLAERYARSLDHITYLGIVGSTKCHHVITDPAFPNTPYKFRIKYMRPDEIWKNALFSEFLNSQKELGWCLSRDWPSEKIEKPFYIVMLQGKQSLASKLIAEHEESTEIMNSTITFLGDYFFGENKEYMKPDKNGDIIKGHINLIIEGMKRSAGPGHTKEDWDNILEDIKQAVYKNIKGELTYSRVVSDCIAQNIVSVNGDSNPSKKEYDKKMAWVDQGYRKDLLDTWLAKQNLEPSQENYFKAFWGTPHFNLGHLYFSMQYAENIPTVCKDTLATAVRDFVYNGRFGRQQAQNRIKFTNWGPENSQLAASLFALGELRAAVFNYHIGQHPDEMKKLVDTLIPLIKTGNMYTFTTESTVKNYNN